MSPAARSLRAFAIYLMPLAALLLIAPNVLLTLLGLGTTSEVWIRLAGMLTSTIAVFLWVGAGSEYLPFFRATVMTRLAVPVFLLLFVLAGWVRWPILMFGVIDLAAALWTWSCLQRPLPA